LIKLWKPLREKINYFLSQPPVGTDDVIAFINLRKADLSLITGLFSSGLDDILTCPGTFYCKSRHDLTFFPFHRKLA
jgi:hypothetical protein